MSINVSRKKTNLEVLDVLSTTSDPHTPLIIVGIIPLTKDICVFECVKQEGIECMSEILVVPINIVANAISFSQSTGNIDDIIDTMESHMRKVKPITFKMTWEGIRDTVKEGNGKPYRELI